MLDASWWRSSIHPRPQERFKGPTRLSLPPSATHDSVFLLPVIYSCQLVNECKRDVSTTTLAGEGGRRRTCYLGAFRNSGLTHGSGRKSTFKSIGLAQASPRCGWRKSTSTGTKTSRIPVGVTRSSYLPAGMFLKANRPSSSVFLSCSKALVAPLLFRFVNLSVLGQVNPFSFTTWPQTSRTRSGLARYIPPSSWMRAE